MRLVACLGKIYQFARVYDKYDGCDRKWITMISDAGNAGPPGLKLPGVGVGMGGSYRNSCRIRQEGRGYRPLHQNITKVGLMRYEIETASR